MAHPIIRPAVWPLALPAGLPPDEIARISGEVDRLGDASQYGWGHDIDFGPFAKQGLLGPSFLQIAGALDDWGWWPKRLDGLRVADVGCFTGGISLMMAHRGATAVYAVDEIPEHLAQCAFIAETFGMPAVKPVQCSIYRLRDDIEPGSLDIVVLAGVLYHLSDMLVGLYALRELLKPGGLLLIQSSGVDDFEHSYANFNRFYAGNWWQPTGLCIKDMCEFMGYADTEVIFYLKNQCLARTSRKDTEIPFRRGLNWDFDDIHDRKFRTLDWSILAPAPFEPKA